MTALVLPAATPDSSTTLPALDSLDGLDSEALAAVADALLTASEPSAPAAPVEAAAVAAAVAPAAAPAGRVRRRRGPADCSPAGLAAREAMIIQHLPLVRYVANAMARHAGQSVLLVHEYQRANDSALRLGEGQRLRRALAF